MPPIAHIVEPSLLYVTWQSPDESATDRLRRTIATVSGRGESTVFRYLKDSADLPAAQAAGFQGFPAFSISQVEHRVGVLESLRRRLPPSKREDFNAYLAQHHLPAPWIHSELALLGYTGGSLPSDGFAFVPLFASGAVPCDYITEVAGLRHVFHGDTGAIRPGDAIELKTECDNPIDRIAIGVLWRGHKLGYLNRALLVTANRWLSEDCVSASVDRINGRPGRPLLHVRIEVREVPSATDGTA